MARRAAQEIAPGDVVNLGIGLPTRVADVAKNVMLHSENGLLGMGPYPPAEQADPQVINAGKQPVTIADGGCCFDSTLSFAMIRGGHIDLAIMGAMQVAQNGDLANWAVPGGATKGIGGAMDLAAGARRLLIVMRHVTKTGAHKLLERCSYPLTACATVSRIVTDLAVLDPAGDAGFALIEAAPGVTLADIQRATAAPLLDQGATPLRDQS